MPACHWRKWLMIKGPISCARCLTTLGLILQMVLGSGCSLTRPPEQLGRVATTLEAGPEEAKRGNDSLLADTPKQTEQNALAEVDEKNSIFFSLGSSAINLSGKEKLRDAAKLLKNDKKQIVTLIGHANDNGSPSFNLAVADARVQSVGAFLKSLGVKFSQIKKKVYGGEKLLNVCQSVKCRQTMRRVELVFSEKISPN